MTTFISFDTLDEFYEYNLQAFEDNYLQYFHLFGIFKKLAAGEIDLFRAYNIEDENGNHIIGLWVTGHLIFYSQQWNDAMIENLEENIPLRRFTNFNFLGKRDLVLRILERNAIPNEIVKDRLIYVCTSVNQIELPEGILQQCCLANLGELGQFGLEYHIEEYNGEGGRDLDYMTAVVRQSILNEGMFQWTRDKSICSIAQIINVGDNYPVIGHLYTPQEQRNNNYATAILHSLTNKLLSEGYEKTALVSDVTNQASNRVFVKVGYIPIYSFIICFKEN